MKSFLAILVTFLSFSSNATSNRWEGLVFPSFSLADQHGKVRNNDDFKNKWLIVYFYPKDRTPGCTIEAQKFVDDYTQFQELNTEIVGVSYDSVQSHKDFADTYEMKFTLLADVEKKLSKAMDVDRFLPWPHPSRQTFLIDPKGVIVKHYEDVDPKTHSKELLVDIKSLIKAQ